MVYFLYKFEFNAEKSFSNKIKHGIDFVQAQQLWLDYDLIEIQARSLDEARFLVIGRIAGKHWSAVVSYRTDKIRIISVRRSRFEEERLYEKSKEADEET